MKYISVILLLAGFGCGRGATPSGNSPAMTELDPEPTHTPSVANPSAEPTGFYAPIGTDVVTAKPITPGMLLYSGVFIADWHYMADDKRQTVSGVIRSKHTGFPYSPASIYSGDLDASKELQHLGVSGEDGHFQVHLPTTSGARFIYVSSPLDAYPLAHSNITK